MQSCRGRTAPEEVLSSFGLGKMSLFVLSQGQRQDEFELLKTHLAIFFFLSLELREKGIQETIWRSQYPWNILKHGKLLRRNAVIPGQDCTVLHQQVDPQAVP